MIWRHLLQLGDSLVEILFVFLFNLNWLRLQQCGRLVHQWWLYFQTPYLPCVYPSVESKWRTWWCCWPVEVVPLVSKLRQFADDEMMGLCKSYYSCRLYPLVWWGVWRGRRCWSWTCRWYFYWCNNHQVSHVQRQQASSHRFDLKEIEERRDDE